MTVGRSPGRIGWGDLHGLAIVLPPGQGVTVRRGDRAGCGAGEDDLDSHGKILSNAEPTFAWQSKGQGFESPQLHSHDVVRIRQSLQVRLGVGQPLSIFYDRLFTGCVL